MELADALSRLPPAVTVLEKFEEYFALFEVTTLTAKDVAIATRRDHVLSTDADFTLNGWPKQFSDDLKPFYARGNELSLKQEWKSGVSASSFLKISCGRYCRLCTKSIRA